MPWGNDINKEIRNYRIIMIGTVLYIVLYFIMGTKYVDNYAVVEKYKWVFSYLLMFDLLIVCYYMLQGVDIKKDDKKDSKEGKSKKGREQMHNVSSGRQHSLYRPQSIPPLNNSHQMLPKSKLPNIPPLNQPQQLPAMRNAQNMPPLNQLPPTRNTNIPPSSQPHQMPPTNKPQNMKQIQAMIDEASFDIPIYGA